MSRKIRFEGAVWFVALYESATKVVACGKSKQANVRANVENGADGMIDVPKTVAVLKYDLSEFPFMNRPFRLGEDKFTRYLPMRTVSSLRLFQ